GGTWYRVASSEADVSVVTWRLAGACRLRWSPLGYPLKPQLAKSWKASEDRREYTVTLRQGLRRSHGHPFSSDDILYWWEQDDLYFDFQPNFMLIKGERGDIEKIDEHTVRFRFPHPHALFPEVMATNGFWAPRHYLQPFHPGVGDPALREKM